MTPTPDDAPARIRSSWERNATAWTDAVRARRIESRRVATDAAIVAAVTALGPARVLDVGCGEGWLCRALAERGIPAVGIDGCAALARAAAATGMDALTLDYAGLVRAPLALGRFDAAVCNFSLFERELGPLLGALATLLRPRGTLVVQTVHPGPADDGGDGWREEDCASLGPGFVSALPWYRRGLATWRQVLSGAGYRAGPVQTVHHPQGGEPLSIILQATPIPETSPCS